MCKHRQTLEHRQTLGSAQVLGNHVYVLELQRTI